MSQKILIVDDERVALKNLEHVMKKEGYDVTATQSGQNAIKLMSNNEFDVILSDLKMQNVDGMQILQKAKELLPDAEVIIITGFATLETAIEATKKGAFYYIAKPFKLDEVRKVVKEAAEKVRLKKENRYLKQKIDSFTGKVKIITQNPTMLALLDTAKQIAPTNCNVFIFGESGTGKELFARYIHLNSNRAEKPFVAINCGAFSEQLLDSELFGHEKGAFTGAYETKKGLVESAEGGTLFLDEITEMSPSMQVKLLRVIQEKEVLRVGGTKSISVDVRFIAATNRDLQHEIKKGSFRQDLYFRLNVVSLQIPPLCERKDDIVILSQYFLEKYASAMQKKVTNISQDVLAILMSYDFPGNVRELENIIARGVALTNSETIEVSHLPDDLALVNVKTYRKSNNSLPTLEEQELSYIKWVLKESNGNKTIAAKVLGIDRVSLWRKLKKYGLE